MNMTDPRKRHHSPRKAPVNPTRGQDFSSSPSPEGAIPLLQRLKTLFVDSSATTLRDWLKQGRILVDGEIETDPRRLVPEAAHVALAQRSVVARLRSGSEMAIPILHRDPELIIINKPAGLLSVAAAYEKEDCARALLQKQLHGQVLAVHRLDRETSGVMCFARTESTQQKLKELFAEHNLRRQYVAVVEGHLADKQGSWTSWLWEDPVTYQVREVREPITGAQLATTHFEVLREGVTKSLLRLTLETGRKHQIRVHCAAAGTPVVGDTRYGKAGPRLALHAQLLELVHPVYKELLSIAAPYPEGFNRLLNKRN
jgi:23S rRNA pseudouridine1911/1915/1917 synthase